MSLDLQPTIKYNILGVLRGLIRNISKDENVRQAFPSAVILFELWGTCSVSKRKRPQGRSNAGLAEFG